ncbi:UNKNOWN [Stylonychia lemnae]|uniref:CAP-Gly domain-containing protein n=1 Tax=Stylonychia lemnae TaxID=5949 RepID=A0A078B9L3_STYLE|nr:UNKNOWN [Stylonychia lemnae]|eukprot:CDW91225.1 UNKNOWN [Stylonychia lemnae]
MSQIQIGNRVAINSFKFKGQEGVVKFYGEVEDKIGIWVGVELDVILTFLQCYQQPKGDMDGSVNGMMLFECRPGHGLLLRSTQVKVIAAQVDVPKLNIATNNNVSDSPLLTPKDPPVRQMGGVLAQAVKQASQNENANQEVQNNAGDAGESKTSSWKDRLEKLRKQKELKKLQDEEIKAHASHNEEQKKEQEEIKKVFEPAPGIQRDKDGKLAVKQQEVVRQSLRPGLRQQEPQPMETVQHQSSTEQQVAPEKTEEKKATGLASRLGAGMKQTAAQSRIQGRTSVNPANTAGKTSTVQATDAAKEKIMKKNEEVRAKLESRQSEVKTGPAGTAASRVAQSRLGAAAQQQNAQDKTKSEPQPKVDPSAALRAGVKRTVGQTAETRTSTVSSQNRPLTARQQKAEEDKKQSDTTPAQKTTGATSSRQSNVRGTASIERQQVRNKVGLPKTQSIEDPNFLRQSIIEEEEEPGTRRPNISRTIISHALQRGNSIVKQSEPSQQTQAFAGAGSVSQVEFKKQEAELRKKKEEAFALQIEVKELSEKINEMQLDNVSRIEMIKTEYEIKILELEQKLNETQLMQPSVVTVETPTQNNEQTLLLQHQIEEQKAAYRAEIDKLAHERDEAIKKVHEQADLLKAAEVEKIRLQEEVEARQLDIETIQLEIDALKDEREELISQIKMSSEINDQASLAGLTEDELKSQNTKLRQAISALTMGFEVEKSKMQSKIHDLEKRAALVDDYEKKLEDMDLLIEEVEIKDQEIKAMEEKIDEGAEYEKMVEEMAEEILKKEEENEQLIERINELEEMNGVQEELNENQENYVKELNQDIAGKDAEIFNLEQNVTQLEEMVLEQDQKIQKYKDKCNELTQKSKMLQEELQSAYSAGDQKVKISTLIEKQNQLITKLRDAGKKDMETMVQKIEFWQEKLKMRVIEGFVPKRLVEESRLDSLEKIQMLNKTKNKALLLTREICEKQILQSEQNFDDKLQWAIYLKLLINISEYCIRFIDSCGRIMYIVQKMSIEKYQELTKLMAWNKFELINTFLDRVMELLKDEALSYKFDISPFIQCVKSVTDLQYTSESRYIEKSTDELAQERASGQVTSNLSVSQQERQKDLKYVPKLSLRNECLKMGLGIIALSAFNQNNKMEETQTKCKLIYWRILEIIFRIDSIELMENGSEFLNMQELGTDNRLDQKYSSIRVMWERDPQSQVEPQERDWSSILEAIERDITQLNNDYKFKKLASKIDQEYHNSQIVINDIYAKGWDAKGPWTLIVDKIRQDLEDTGAMKEKIESLQEKVKDQAMQFLMLKREKDDLSVVNQSLEQRLGDAQSKAEKVPALEMEKKRLIEKESYYSQQIEMAKKEIENLREKEKDLQGKLADFENNPVLARELNRSSTKRMVMQSTTNAQTRQSRTSQYFQKLAQSSLLGHKRESMTPLARQSTSVTSNELQKQLQISEEAFTNVIVELQKDRMQLKGQHLLERLHKLEKTEGPMNEYIKLQREKRDIGAKISRQDQINLEQALDNVMYLKKKMKKEMALIKVIDITKREEQQLESEKQLKNEIIHEGMEKVNYEFLKAKDQVNEAFKVLFGKDSRLHQIQSFKERQVQNLENTHNILKLGTLRLSGAPIKSVISLIPTEVKDLNQHINMFNQI